MKSLLNVTEQFKYWTLAITNAKWKVATSVCSTAINDTTVHFITILIAIVAVYGRNARHSDTTYLNVTEFQKERTNQDRTKIGPFFNFLLHYLIFLLEIFSMASQLSCETLFKISCKNAENVGKIKKGPILALSYPDRTKIGAFLIGPFLFNLCHGYIYMIHVKHIQFVCGA